MYKEEFGEDAGSLEAELQARMAAGETPGRIAMELEGMQPGLGRAFLLKLRGTQASEGAFAAARGAPLTRSSFRPVTAADIPISGFRGSTAPWLEGQGAARANASLFSPMSSQSPARSIQPKPGERGVRQDPNSWGAWLDAQANRVRRLLDPGGEVQADDGHRYRRFRDGSVEIPLPPAEPWKPGVRSKDTQAQIVANPPPKTAQPRTYEVKSNDIIIPDLIDQEVRELGRRFTEATGTTLWVTDAQRDAAAQARVMFDDFASGERGEKYRNQVAAQEIVNAYLEAKRKGYGRRETENAMAEVIGSQMERGTFISLHLLDRGIDVRTKDLTPAQKKALRDAAKAMGAKPTREGDHLHIEFPDSPASR